MKSKHIGVLSAGVVSIVTALAVLGGLASLSVAATGGPTVVLSSTSASSTNAATIPITATFSESVGTFASSSVTATNATVSAVSGSGTTYTFDLTPTAQGAVTVMLPADVASSTASSTGSQLSNTLVFNYDSAPPVISGTTVAPITETSATLHWTTDELASGSVNYGTTASYTASSTNATSSLAHSIALSSLVASTTYHYQLVSVDAAGNTATSSDATFTTSAATPAAPVISNTAASAMSTTSATITWSTDIQSDSQVMYGTSNAYGSMSTLDTTATTTHSVTLTGLSEATLYHFQVRSTNAGGTATSSDMVFVTQSTASSTPLLVTGTDTTKGNATADGTFASGWEWVLHFIIPDVENNFAMKFGDFINGANASTTIAAANNIRIWSAQSSNASTTASSMLESGNGYSGDMMLNGDAATTTPGRQVDVHVQVAVPAGTPTGTYSTTFGAMSTTTPF